MKTWEKPVQRTSERAVLQEAHAVTKASRGELANALAEVKANMVITTKQRQKQGLERMLEVLQQLREAAHLHDALRRAPTMASIPTFPA